MASDLAAAEEIVRPLIRGIDKRAEYSLTMSPGDRPGVTVTISLRKRTTSVRIPLEDLHGATQDLIRRNRLRTSLKHAIDQMTVQSMPIAKTKMLRAAVQNDGFFRPAQGGRRGRR